MHQDMIKPYIITKIREETNDAKTVFFSITKTEEKPCGGFKVYTLESTIYVSKEEDMDQVIFNALEKSDWI